MKVDWIDIILILFGLFVAYQLIKAILGGSWQMESLIISLLVFNIGLTYKISLKFEGHINWHKLREK